MDKKEGVILKNEDGYPRLLKEIPAVPEKIFWRGEKSLLNEELCLAIVGTRKATAQGKELARNLGRELAELGAVIVSGLAMGIDSAAHQGALEAEISGGRPGLSPHEVSARRGKTIAVLGNGIDKIYPAQNENLAESILQSGGLIISEYPPETPSYPNQFLERNRIVSGLCSAVIVIEAPQRSGSLHTARLAAEQGREVFVFPGPADHPNFGGSHKLIRDGARLVSSAADIIEDLGLEVKNNFIPEEELSGDESGSRQKILKAVFSAGRPLSIDKISELTKLEPSEANEIVAYLVIEGKIKETDRGYAI